MYAQDIFKIAFRFDLNFQDPAADVNFILFFQIKTTKIKRKKKE